VCLSLTQAVALFDKHGVLCYFPPSLPFLCSVVHQSPMQLGMKIILLSDIPVDLFLFFHSSHSERFMKMFSFPRE
jgi:hypothetical protein